MLKVEKIDVWGFEHAIRGMRNSFNSWNKSDTVFGVDGRPVIGENDMELMRKLCKAGSTHRKFLRQIMVSMDITAPLYWWKEFDTYKVGTVANSCSTMHKIHAREFTLDDFSHEHLVNDAVAFLEDNIEMLNQAREVYVNYDNYPLSSLDPKITCKKDVWWHMIQLLPSSYNQKRTVTMSYENVLAIIEQRTGHKLDEWGEFVRVLHGLPYVDEIMKETEVNTDESDI